MLGFKHDRQNPCCLYRRRQSRPKLTNHQKKGKFNHFQNWAKYGITKQNPVRTAYTKPITRSPLNLFKFVTNFICQKEAEVKTFRHQEKKKLKCTDRIAKQSRSFKNTIKNLTFKPQNGESLFRTKKATKCGIVTLKTAADNQTKQTNTQNHAWRDDETIRSNKYPKCLNLLT